MSSFDVVAVGNATLDNFLWIQDENKHFRLDTQTRELCIKMGDKTLIEKAYFVVGGNAANVSVGLSRLGFRVAVVAEVGDDEFAQKILNTLSREGVTETFLKKSSHKSTSFSVIINYKGDRVILEEKVEKDHNYSLEGIETKWIYLTSIGDSWENAYNKVLSFVKQKGISLAFNPGSAQLDSGSTIVDDAISLSEIVFLNKEEASKICGTESANDDSLVPHLLSTIKNKGAKIVVITDGGKGAHMIDSAGQTHFAEASPSAIVERTGAGDSFASGFLGGILSGAPASDAMAWGSRNAASVIGKIGAQEGLLRKEDYEQ